MQLKEFIQQELNKGRTKFDIGVKSTMEVDEYSPNRIQFEVASKGCKP